MTKVISFKQFNEGSAERLAQNIIGMAVRGIIGKYRRNKMAKARTVQSAPKPSTVKSTTTTEPKPTRVAPSMKDQRRDQRDADSMARLHKHFSDKYGPDYKEKWKAMDDAKKARKERISKAQDDAVHARISKKNA